MRVKSLATTAVAALILASVPTVTSTATEGDSAEQSNTPVVVEQPNTDDGADEDDDSAQLDLAPEATPNPETSAPELQATAIDVQAELESAATRTVCASGCQYTTINAAVAAASSGDTIEVRAGIYAEDLIRIGKAVTISGPNSTVSGSDGNRSPEAIVKAALLPDVNGVTITGLTIDGTGVNQTPDLQKRGILVANTNAVANTTIRNNIIEGWVTGISLAGGGSPGWVNTAVITGNKLTNNGIGSTENATNLTITENTFDNGGVGLGGGASLAAPLAGNSFKNGTGRYVSVASGVSLGTGQSLATILESNSFDSAAALSAASGQWYSQAIFATISGAIAVASTGATINVAAGTYPESLSVNQKLTLVGAVDGDGEPKTLISLASGQNGVVVSSSDVQLRNLKIQQAMVGTRFASGITFGASVSDLTLANVTVEGASVGLRVGSGTDVNGLSIIDSHFDNNVQGWYLAAETAASTNGTNVRAVRVLNTTFNGNTQKGIYAEKLSDAIFDSITVNDSGTDPTYGFNNGIDINLKWQSYSDIKIQDSTISSSGAKGSATNPDFPAAVAIKARDDGASYGKPPASLNNVEILGTVIEGVKNALRLGEPGKNNAGPTNVTVIDSSLLVGQVSLDGAGFGLINASQALVSADSNWWGGAGGPGAKAPPGTVTQAPWIASFVPNEAEKDQPGFRTINVTFSNELASLAVSSGVLTPSFDPGTTAYSVGVGNGVSTLALTPSVVVGSGATASVTPSGASIPLAVGANTITVSVANGDQPLTTYTITVTRAAAPDPGPGPAPGPGPTPTPTPSPTATPTPTPTVTPTPVVEPVVIESPTRVTPQQVEALSPGQVATVSPEVIRELPPAAVAALSPQQAAALTPAQVNALRPSRAEALAPQAVVALDPVQLEAMRPASVSRLNPLAICAPLDQECVPGQNGLTAEQIAAFRPAAFGRMQPDQFELRRPTQVTLIPVASLRQIRPEGVRALQPQTVAALAPEQIAALRPRAIGQMSNAQLRRLTPDQVAALTPRQRGALSAQQRQLLGLD